VAWYRKSALQGYALAQFALGLCYKDGLGTEKDKFKVFQYFNLAAQ
jgi:TPR repeat protein